MVRALVPERISGDTSATCSGSRGGFCIMSYGGPSACDGLFIGHPMYKLETGKAALLVIGEQGHATPAHAADVSAFLVITSFILQTQSIVDMCF